MKPMLKNKSSKTILLSLVLTAMLPATGTHAHSLAAQKAKPSTTLPIEGTVVRASHPLLQYMGRVSLSQPDVARFNFPGTTIQARFTGTSLRMWCRPLTGYFMAQVDGAKPFKVGFNAERDSVATIATALPEGEHSVKLMYVIEGLFRQPEFKGLVLDEGARLLPSPALPERKIEFIGNSITCGYGVESIEMTDPFEDETENHWLTYANIVSDSLQAQHTSISRSGIGMYRNYGGPTEGTPENMPWQYAYTLFNDHSEAWDFSRYQPQLVCINLGTNDLSTPGYSLERYEQAYRQFLATVRAKYPEARIVLLTGPMLGEKENNMEKEILDRICKDVNKKGTDGKTKKGDKQVYRFDFTPQTGSLGYGASWHPSLQQHQQMAAELLPYLRKLMEWE